MSESRKLSLRHHGSTANNFWEKFQVPSHICIRLRLNHLIGRNLIIITKNELINTIAIFVNVYQIIRQCYLLVNLTPSDVFRILHIE